MHIKRITALGFGVIASAMLFVLSTGFTFAVWTTERVTYNKVTATSVQGTIKEVYDQGQTIVPNVDVEKKVWVKNTGSADALVRAKIMYQFDDGTPLTENDISFTLNDDDWYYDETDGYYYYRHVLHPEEESAPLFNSFKLNGELTNSQVGETGRVIVHTDFIQAENDGISYWGKTLKQLGIEYTPKAYPNKLMHVTFMGRDKGVALGDGYDMFYNFKELVPGTSRSQDIEVKNQSTEEVYMSLRAEVAGYDSTMTEVQRKQVDEMLKKYITIVITDNDGREWYKGPIWGNLDADGENRLESMRYDHDLGYFAPNQKKNLHISMTFSPDMPQYADDLIGYVNWVFKVTAFDQETPLGAVTVGDEPLTGLGLQANTLLPIALTTSGASLLCLVALLKRKKTQKKEEA